MTANDNLNQQNAGTLFDLSQWDWLRQPLCCVDLHGIPIIYNNLFSLWIQDVAGFELNPTFLYRVRQMIHRGSSDHQRYADWSPDRLKAACRGSEAVVLRIGEGQALLGFFLHQPFQQRSDLFQRILESSPLMLGICDLKNARLADVNDSFTTVTGLDRQTLLTSDLHELPIWEDNQFCDSMIAELQKNGEVLSRLTNMRDCEGEIHSVLVSLKFLMGKQDYVVFVGADVSAQRHLVQALSDAEERFRDLLAHAPEPTILLDVNSGYFIVANHAALALFNMPLEKLLAMGPVELSPEYQPDGNLSRNKVKEYVALALAGKVSEFPWTHLDGEGQPIPCYIRLVALPGNLVRANITDLRQNEHNAYEMEKMSRALEQTDDIVMITDVHGILEYVNSAFQNVTGYALEEVLGRPTSILASGDQDAVYFEEMWQTILSGRVFKGIFNNRRKDGSLFIEEKTISPIIDAKGFITHFVSTGRDISEKLRTDQQLNHLANYDLLTDLPNLLSFRERLFDALNRARRHSYKVGMIMMDLDRFKVINDTLGHHVGDEFLRQVAKRLQDRFRMSDALARLGGDEFALLVEPVGEQQALLTVIQKLLELFGESFSVGDHELYSSISLGVSIFPNDGDDVHTLMKNADTAMFRAKRAGGNRFEMYRSDMNARAQERLTLETELRGALRRKEFFLHYQPQWDLNRRKLVGVEALVRWRHGSGTISPGEFVPLLEETGLIGEVGEWILEEACGQLKRWSENGLHDLRLAVNLSPNQFATHLLASRVEQLLRRVELKPGLLELEITESTLMQQGDLAVSILDELKNLGVRLAIDDFGTGYSSLAYLKRFPIDVLKIDRSFLIEVNTRQEDAAIVETILGMARSLELEVVAEGIEAVAQLDFLERLGCQFVQGYLLARPMPAEQFFDKWQAGEFNTWPH